MSAIWFGREAPMPGARRYSVDHRARPSVVRERGQIVVEVLAVINGEEKVIQKKVATPDGGRVRIRYEEKWVDATREGNRWVYRVPKRDER